MALTVPAVELRSGAATRRTPTGEFLEVFEEPAVVRRQVPATRAGDPGGRRVDQVHAGVHQSGDVPGCGDAGEVDGGVGRDGLPGGDERVDERTRVADDPLCVRENERVDGRLARPAGVGCVTRHDGRRRAVDLGKLGGEGVDHLLAGAGGERTVWQHRHHIVVTLGHRPVFGPETAGVAEHWRRVGVVRLGVDPSDECRCRHRLGQTEFTQPGGAVPVVNLEVVGHTSDSGCRVQLPSEWRRSRPSTARRQNGKRLSVACPTR
ncbi:MAG: hypothetical protein J07HB67_02598 [halophilic archaeon J07HB67]|nr:MAG: hypothetical protein J07HB67_02598 [halophilic archaeon J07HB67]